MFRSRSRPQRPGLKIGPAIVVIVIGLVIAGPWHWPSWEPSGRRCVTEVPVPNERFAR